MKQDNDHKITKIHHFAELYKHSNVTFNIQMLERSKVRSNVEHSFMHYYKGELIYSHRPTLYTESRNATGNYVLVAIASVAEHCSYMVICV